LSGLNNDGKWWHVAATRDISGVASIFIDGRLDATATLTSGALMNATTAFSLGSTSFGTIIGHLDDVMFFHRVLTVSEIATLAARRGIIHETVSRTWVRAGGGPPPPGFKPYWARRTSQILGGR
jgi:uncharacterized protein YrrD